MPATIAQLGALPPPSDLPNDQRIAPAELTTYVVRARLLDFKCKHDDDFHLVIAERGDCNKTMIAEIAAAGCSKAEALLARAALLVLVRNLGARPTWLKSPVRDFITSNTVRTAWHRMPSNSIRSWLFGGYRNKHTLAYWLESLKSALTVC